MSENLRCQAPLKSQDPTSLPCEHNSSLSGQTSAPEPFLLPIPPFKGNHCEIRQMQKKV